MPQETWRRDAARWHRGDLLPTIAAFALVLLLALLGGAGPLRAQTASTNGPAAGGVAQFNPSQSWVAAEGYDTGKPRPLTMRLAVGARSPWRAYLLDGPPRLVVEVQGLGLPPSDAAALPGAELIPALRWGPGLPGWGRIVAELPGPYALERPTITGAGARQGSQRGSAAIELALRPVAADDFAPRRDRLGALHGLPEPAAVAPSNGPHARLRVVIDPGHGGIDPGAQVGTVTEAALMLGFATELAGAMRAAGMDARLTRGDNRFIPLDRRASAARRVQADLFISLHADMLPRGQAAGATIYVWNPESNDRAARELASRHDRDDVLAGVDLEGSDDQITRALIDLARGGTQPRSEALAAHLSRELALSDIGMHRRPVQGAAFSVLKSPDIPSVLIELGFLSDPLDRANLINPAWRARMAAAMVRAVANWQAEDAGRPPLRGAMPQGEALP
ncbi:N-acetylmuramoyl-L-alanine amidase [uncultured Paracoccus sp.]|uniref:N-acetylmuramoyl-L-alanine amidase family protein n=1 Tax=uncultured Paracoccus sp. TaxID=189685 RepID=UPI00262E9347|nr:N-acetylmuramoyl-L-alanine amidase [uncultured Paracoccus sp.]